VHLGFSNKKIFEVFYLMKSKNIKIRYIENILFPYRNFNQIVEHPIYPKTNNCKTKETNTNYLGNIYSNNKASHRKYATLKNFNSKKIDNKFQKEYNFSSIINPNSNYHKKYGNSLIVDNISNKLRLPQSPLKESLLHYENFKKVFHS